VEKRTFFTPPGLELRPLCRPADSQSLYRMSDQRITFPKTAPRYDCNQSVQNKKKNKQTPWSESASELYRPSGRRLSAKRLPTFADKGCHVISVTDPYGRNLDFLDRSRYFSIKYLFRCTHEAEWTSFQTHYFFFVVPGIEPGPPDL
jgi:hypothetical protein